jgi:phosphatidylinositol glycan class S
VSYTCIGQVSRSRSFLLPQWGGIIIYNPPIDDTAKNMNLPSETNDHIFKEFSKELLNLLGVPTLPNGVRLHASESANLSDWQVDALRRRRTAENVKNTQETLTSIIKLVNQINNMPVKEDVRDDVQGALEALEQVGSQQSS